MYIRLSDNKYPVSESEIRAANPNTSYPQPFPVPEGHAWVFPIPQPTFDPVLQAARETTPQLTDKGVWEQRWAVVPRFAEYTDDHGVVHTVAEQESAAIATARDAQAVVVRATRNQLLTQTDWTQVADAPVDKAAWAAYRQALRDVPVQAGFPWDVIWPEQP